MQSLRCRNRTSLYEVMSEAVLSTTTLPCGCKHDDRSWLVLCEPHLIAWFDTHRIAADQNRTANRPPAGAEEDVQ
jgi:hypothetical protein